MNKLLHTPFFLENQRPPCSLGGSSHAGYERGKLDVNRDRLTSANHHEVNSFTEESKSILKVPNPKPKFNSKPSRQARIHTQVGQNVSRFFLPAPQPYGRQFYCPIALFSCHGTVLIYCCRGYSSAFHRCGIDPIIVPRSLLVGKQMSLP